MIMKRRGLTEEDLMHKQFGSMVHQYQLMGKLDCSWWSYDASGENRTLKTGALLKAKGLIPGASDYKFKYLKKNIAYYLYLEFKTSKGKQSESQKRFEESCIAVNEKYYIVRSVKEAIELLIREGIIIE